MNSTEYNSDTDEQFEDYKKKYSNIGKYFEKNKNVGYTKFYFLTPNEIANDKDVEGRLSYLNKRCFRETDEEKVIFNKKDKILIGENEYGIQGFLSVSDSREIKTMIQKHIFSNLDFAKKKYRENFEKTYFDITFYLLNEGIRQDMDGIYINNVCGNVESYSGLASGLFNHLFDDIDGKFPEAKYAYLHVMTDERNLIRMYENFGFKYVNEFLREKSLGVSVMAKTFDEDEWLDNIKNSKLNVPKIRPYTVMV